MHCRTSSDAMSAKALKLESGKTLTFIEVATKMVRLYKTSRLVGICMERVQMSADMFDRTEVLQPEV